MELPEWRQGIATRRDRTMEPIRGQNVAPETVASLRGRRTVDAGLVGGVRWRGLGARPDSAKSAIPAAIGWWREPDVGLGRAAGAESCDARRRAPRSRVALFRLLHQIGRAHV